MIQIFNQSVLRDIFDSRLEFFCARGSNENI
jgi:hypothetical protein